MSQLIFKFPFKATYFENDFYDFCRTKNQLGYLVNMSNGRLGETYILQQTYPYHIRFF